MSPLPNTYMGELNNVPTQMSAIRAPQADRIAQAMFLFPNLALRWSAAGRVSGELAGLLLQGCTLSFQKPIHQAQDDSPDQLWKQRESEHGGCSFRCWCPQSPETSGSAEKTG